MNQAAVVLDEQTVKKIIDTQQKQIDNLLKENNALRLRKNFLETRLTQRCEKSVVKYRSEEFQALLSRVEKNVCDIFLAAPKQGFTYDEVIEDYEFRFKHKCRETVRRTMRKLREEGKLWSNNNELGKPVFYLRLES